MTPDIGQKWVHENYFIDYNLYEASCTIVEVQDYQVTHKTEKGVIVENFTRIAFIWCPDNDISTYLLDDFLKFFRPLTEKELNELTIREIIE